MLRFLFCSMALFGFVSGQYLQLAGQRVESAVVGANGYFLGQMTPQGGVALVGFDGSSSDWSPITGLDNVRGLAITPDKGELFVAHDGGVSHYAVDAAGWSEMTTYNTSAAGVDEPNGLCLNADGTRLFATQPGWKAFPWGPSLINGLVMIDLATGVVLSLFSDMEGHSPNGCAVDGDIVWMINMKDGVTSYDIYGGNVLPMAPWSKPVYDYQLGQYAGDGIVIYYDKVLISTWKPMPKGGVIWECTPSQGVCAELNKVVACDLQLDQRDPSMPKLLAPSLVDSEVLVIDLIAPAVPTAGPRPRMYYTVNAMSRQCIDGPMGGHDLDGNAGTCTDGGVAKSGNVHSYEVLSCSSTCVCFRQYVGTRDCNATGTSFGRNAKQACTDKCLTDCSWMNCGNTLENVEVTYLKAGGTISCSNQVADEDFKCDGEMYPDAYGMIENGDDYQLKGKCLSDRTAAGCVTELYLAGPTPSPMKKRKRGKSGGATPRKRKQKKESTAKRKRKQKRTQRKRKQRN